jgi:lactate dehydrogenase-like 2-hydroxyacid dehydrogenase
MLGSQQMRATPGARRRGRPKPKLQLPGMHMDRGHSHSALYILVGLTVARLAKGLGMNVNALDPYASPAVAASAPGARRRGRPKPKLQLPGMHMDRGHSHSCLNPWPASTRGMIAEAELAQLKPGARVLNVARGGTFDEDAARGWAINRAAEESGAGGSDVNTSIAAPERWPDSRGMIAEAELAQLKPGARVLNVARGGTFDEDALLAGSWVGD